MEILRAIRTNNTVPCYEIVQLAEEYGDQVYRFCRILAYCKEDADDLFQETFLKACEQQTGLSNWDNPQGFLFSTSLYIWKTWKRKYARRKRLVPVAPFKDTVASDINTEDDFLVSEEVRVVRELVQALPDKFKISIILYYTAEMSISDIASALKIPAGTVKSRLFKARKLIGKGLSEYESQ